MLPGIFSARKMLFELEECLCIWKKPTYKTCVRLWKQHVNVYPMEMKVIGSGSTLCHHWTKGSDELYI